MPYQSNTVLKHMQNDGRLVHYTSADAAYKIIQNKQFWLRNSQEMNDFSEIDYGISLLNGAMSNQTIGKQFEDAVNKISPNSFSALRRNFEIGQSYTKRNTYIMSLSEHGSRTFDEDKYGRLSMWRAYGGDTNVAMVFNSNAVLKSDLDIPVSIKPIQYLDQNTFNNFSQQTIETLQTKKAQKLIQSLGASNIMHYLFWWLECIIITTKHPGFSEEKEWRVFYSARDYAHQYSGISAIQPDVETIGGVPQTVYKICLSAEHQGWEAENKSVGVHWNNFLDKIIIGPSSSSWVIYQAFCDLLHRADARGAYGKVCSSDIPIRR